eukprot:scaffold20399_cov60-Phaeocystis_antarctica.AAC.6
MSPSQPLECVAAGRAPCAATLGCRCKARARAGTPGASPAAGRGYHARSSPPCVGATQTARSAGARLALGSDGHA